MSEAVRILIGDVREGLRSLPERSVHCVVTSPPYWGLRDYGVDGQIGLEATPEAFVETMVEVFREVRRVMRDDATLWLNLGDSYAAGGLGGGSPDGKQRTNVGSCNGSHVEKPRKAPPGLKPKDLCMVPWRVALALQADGWWLRSIIAWHKRSPMPESCTDRPTSSWEPIFLLAKRDRYFYDAEAVKERSSENTHSRGAAGRGPDEAVIGYKTDAPGSGNRNNSDFQRYMGDRPPEARRNMRNVWTLSSEPFTDWAETVHWVRVEAGAVGDDIRRTLSEGCPVHDRQGLRSDGEHEGGQSIHSRGSSAHLDQARHPGTCANSPNRDSSARGDSSGSSCPSSVQTATDHNTRTRKTALAPETTPTCTPSAQKCGGTRGSKAKLESSDSAAHTTESSTVAGSASRETETGNGQTIFHSEGTCTCQYHRRVTKRIDHFATFPSEIPRRAIKAGTSEKGCCPHCGTPWERVVEAWHENPGNRNTNGTKSATKDTGELGGCGYDVRLEKRSRTIGWKPGCACPDHRPVPCVVLDPFLGSGTTIAAARQLGRHGVGCELNPAYAELARVRIGKAEKPHTFVDTREPEEGGLFK